MAASTGVTRPLLIGIAGASGSGKTELARAVHLAYAGETLHFELDHYYRDLSAMPAAERAMFNFDHPDALDADLLLKDLAAFKADTPIAQPRYSFVTHTRLPDSEILKPHPLIFVEGIFSLYWPALRQLLDLRIYVEAPDEECFRRRAARDVHERGRTTQGVTEQYERTVSDGAAICASYPSSRGFGN